MEESVEMVEEYNKYFSSVFTCENLRDLPQAEMMFTGKEQDKCGDFTFSQEDILDVLKKIRPDKAAGIRMIFHQDCMLVQVKEQLCYPLHNIFRKSLDEGSVPDDWRRAYVTPIFKKRNRGLAENYIDQLA